MLTIIAYKEIKFCLKKKYTVVKLEKNFAVFQNLEHL